MVDESKRCTAKSKQTGKRCRRPATPSKRVCYYHGGASTGPKTPEGREKCSLAAMVHGAYVARILNEDEQHIYDGFLAQMREDFVLNNSSDEVAVLMAAVSFLQFYRAQQAGKETVADTQARIIRNCLKDLKATKIAREGETVSPTTSPAEWAAAILDKIRQEAGKGRSKADAKKEARRGKTQK